MRHSTRLKQQTKAVVFRKIHGRWCWLSPHKRFSALFRLLMRSLELLLPEMSNSSSSTLNFDEFVGVHVPAPSPSVKNRFRIAIHGGAGLIARLKGDPDRKDYRKTLKKALKAGWKILSEGGTAREACLRSVVFLEESPLFNAGIGSVYTYEGGHEMDAAVMDGSNLSAGACTCIEHIRNPILLADEIRIHSNHVFLSGAGAEEFAKLRGFSMVSPSLFDTKHRREAWEEQRKQDSNKSSVDHSSESLLSSSSRKTILRSQPILSSSSSSSSEEIEEERKFGTVGAVALDSSGNLFAATSTGGMTNKRFNRIGDTPCIGAGTYCSNKSAAVSCTGFGEFFIRQGTAKEVCCAMEYGKLKLKEASEAVVKKFKSIGEEFEGGLIAIDREGNISMPFNSEGLYRGYALEDGNPEVFVWKSG